MLDSDIQVCHSTVEAKEAMFGGGYTMKYVCVQTRKARHDARDAGSFEHIQQMNRRSVCAGADAGLGHKGIFIGRVPHITAPELDEVHTNGYAPRRRDL
jgi:hypothetical protein